MEQCAFLLLVFASILTMVNAREGTPLPLMGEHRCDRNSYVAQGNSFRWSKRLNPGKPSRTYIKGEYPYAFSKTLQKGQTLYVRGTVNGDASYFELNLMGGVPMIIDSNGADALHIKTTFGWTKQTYVNTWKRNKWLDQITFAGPFEKGQPFLISIYAGNSGFELRFNGKKWLDYAYRVPVDVINFINVRGDVDLDNIYVGGQKFEMNYHIGFHEANNFAIGDRLVLTGIGVYMPFELALNATNGDYLFYLQVDFEHQVITRSAKIQNQWVPDETGGGFPLKSTEEFELALVNHEEALEIYFNDKWYTSFGHKNLDLDYNTAFDALQLNGALEPRTLVLCKNQP
uniref:Galectin n=1 Tax=Panagrellus redivivus TaxID=6233 RepID=A0A7E4V3S1_PANRE